MWCYIAWRNTNEAYQKSLKQAWPIFCPWEGCPAWWAYHVETMEMCFNDYDMADWATYGGMEAADLIDKFKAELRREQEESKRKWREANAISVKVKVCDDCYLPTDCGEGMTADHYWNIANYTTNAAYREKWNNLLTTTIKRTARETKYAIKKLRRSLGLRDE